ncbi:hypothetical protein [Fructilactobacillus sanfranciscensis]|uniref:Uncharacterized protein n=1 Tax=Fructilactobacillus sanfranciscensis TaxID=1625 RepID=A0A5C4TKB5_FRUSA|nr:hypothetical protein [Fructilactobacillus sanfranciscensis]TNK90948.1 hypothetical protein DID87_00960 [Fructilactobacillus sanfranciscensis]
MGVVLIDFVRGNFVIIAPKMQHIVFYASFSMSYVFLYLVGLAQVISFLFYNLPFSHKDFSSTAVDKEPL